MSWTYYWCDSKEFITDETKSIDLKVFKRPNLTDYELSFLLHTTRNIEKRENWYMYKGEYWYLKERVNMRNIFNELLGEYLSTYMNLPTIHYILLVSNGKLVGVASKNFRKKGVNYINASKLTDRQHKHINKVLLSRTTIFNREYKCDLCNYIMRNFYANQGDRMHNVLCEYKYRQIRLAPLYDYEMSFMIPESSMILEPLFLGLDINTNLLCQLFKRDDVMRSSVEKLLDLDMNVALQYIEGENKIIIPEDLKKYYIDYDKSRKQLILGKIKGIEQR